MSKPAERVKQKVRYDLNRVFWIFKGQDVSQANKDSLIGQFVVNIARISSLFETYSISELSQHAHSSSKHIWSPLGLSKTLYMPSIEHVYVYVSFPAPKCSLLPFVNIWYVK